MHLQKEEEYSYCTVLELVVAYKYQSGARGRVSCVIVRSSIHGRVADRDWGSTTGRPYGDRYSRTVGAGICQDWVIGPKNPPYVELYYRI